MSERIVLAGLLALGRHAWVEQSARLDAEMFNNNHRAIFDAIAELHGKGLPVDAINVAERSGLPDLVDDLAQEFVSGSTFPAYVQQLVEHSVAARARAIGADLFEHGDVDEAMQAIISLQSDHGRVNTHRGHDVLADLLDSLQAKADGQDDSIKTGLRDLDEVMMLSPGNLCILAARPRMGKTSLMLNIADRAGVNVGIFSLEMTNAELMARMVAARGVDYGKLQRPSTMTDADWALFTRASGALRDRLFLCDVGGLSINALEAEARRMVNYHKCRLICIDYLQLISHRAESRLEVVSEVARRLKALAKNLAVPVVCLCQLNRGVENRADSTPRLSDLRESGQIEQDADQIVFIDRPELSGGMGGPGDAVLHIAKNRAGQACPVGVKWDGSHQRFTNREDAW